MLNKSDLLSQKAAAVANEISADALAIARARVEGELSAAAMPGAPNPLLINYPADKASFYDQVFGEMIASGGYPENTISSAVDRDHLGTAFTTRSIDLG